MNSNEHIALQIILGTIAEWGIVAFLAYQLLQLFDFIFEWVCENVLNSPTAICIALMLIVVMCVLMVIFDGRGGEDDETV